MTTPPDPTDGRAPGRRERRKEATRAALLDAAMRLFDERGYGQVTVEEICVAADVSPRTFFRYFRTKDDLLLVPITEMLDAVLADLGARPGAESGWDALVSVVLALSRRIDADRDTTLLSWRVFQDSPETLGANARGFLEWDAAMSAQVAARMGLPADDVSPRLITGCALAAFRVAFDHWAARGGPGDLADAVGDALAAVAAGPATVVARTGGARSGGTVG